MRRPIPYLSCKRKINNTATSTTYSFVLLLSSLLSVFCAFWTCLFDRIPVSRASERATPSSSLVVVLSSSFKERGSFPNLMAEPIEQFDASAAEKEVQSPALTGNTTVARNSDAEPESLKSEDSKRYLNEQQAVEWCRKYPESKEPIYITYGQDDKVSPLLPCQR